MSDDLKEIKLRILEEEKIEDLLLSMGCENVTFKSGQRYEARLPAHYNSSNNRSVQVYTNENLSSKIRSKAESSLDIYGLVSYIVHDKLTESEQRSDLPRAKRWICEQLGYTEYIGRNSYVPSPPNRLKWLKEVKKNRKKKRELANMSNPIYPDNILDQYTMMPHIKYLEDGLDAHTQKIFQIGFDMASNRIIFPIHNRYGELISIKGRTTEESEYKFLYLIHFNKMIELFNWHRALEHVEEKKEILVFEGEKSAMLATQHGFPHSVAVAGDDISEWQVQMIKELGTDVDIILAFDKDKDIKDVYKQGKKFGKSRKVYALYDQLELFIDKDSPFDKGLDAFLELYSKCKFKVPH